jgi:acylphosphatase
MTKARFFIKDKVQEVGYRVHIMQKILNSDLEGNVINLADGGVEVRLEGEKERIIEFYEELKKEKPELAKNPHFIDLEFKADLLVPDSMRSSQALMLEQLGKGIVYTAKLFEETMGMRRELREGFSELGNKMDGVGDKIDNLPERIAKALKESK